MAKTDTTPDTPPETGTPPDTTPDTGLENPPAEEQKTEAAPVVAAPAVQPAPVSQPGEINEDADETVPGGRYREGDRLVNANGEPVE